jgi:hypothetical protein
VAKRCYDGVQVYVWAILQGKWWAKKYGYYIDVWSWKTE